MNDTALNDADRDIPHDEQRRRRAHEPASASMTLNMTPMIDVVFLLLIYFMLGSNFKVREESIVLVLPEQLETAQGLQVDPFELPETPIAIGVRSLSDDARHYVLSLDDPSIGKPESPDDLRRLLASARGLAIPIDQEFAIRPAIGTRWEHTLDVLSLIRRAGYEHVHLMNPEHGPSGTER